MKLASMLLVVLTLLLVACSGPACGPREILVAVQNTNMETKFCVEVADTPELWMSGLMNRTVPDGTGMIFIFPDNENRSFWMKNTPTPLAITFIDENKTVIDVQMAEPCLGQDTCPLYLSSRPAMYVLEVNQGFARDIGLGVGNRLQFTHQNQ